MEVLMVTVLCEAGISSVEAPTSRAFAWRLLLRALALTRRASACSARVFSAAFLPLALWMCSTSTRLFLNTLPLTFMYSSWYMLRSIFLASLYFASSRRSTRRRRIQITEVGRRASAVPLRLPVPVTALSLGFQLHAHTVARVHLHWLLDDKTILSQLRMFRRELAMEISFT